MLLKMLLPAGTAGMLVAPDQLDLVLFFMQGLLLRVGDQSAHMATSITDHVCVATTFLSGRLVAY